MGDILGDIQSCCAWLGWIANPLVTSLVVGVLLIYIGHKIQDWTRREGLRVTRERRQRQRQHTFDEWTKRIGGTQPDDQTEHITRLSFSELRENLQTGVLSPTTVLHAFQKQALKAHERTNCLVELIDEAEEWAQVLENHNGPKGDLYGIPFSIKENFPIKGHDTTKGQSKLIGQIHEADCIVVQAMKELGAVCFARTNIPQSGMSHESSNPVFGRTDHPLRPNFTPGGSTSGEGALMALRGSILGWGTDTGGSIRCPAAFCGVCGLKPSSGRTSAKGRIDFNGQTLAPSVSCPIARDVDSLAAVMRVMCSPDTLQLDPLLPPLTFNEQLYSSDKPLRVGYYLNDGFMEVFPACARVVMEAKTKLEAAGHTVVAWTPPRAADGFWASLKSQSGDGGKSFLEAIKHDAVDKDISRTAFVFKLPVWVRKFLATVLQPWAKAAVTGKALRVSCGISSVSQWWSHTVDVQAWREEFVSSWTSAGLDAVICPAFGCPPLPTGSGQLLRRSSYLMIYNLLDFPAGTVPVSRVTEADLRDMEAAYRTDSKLQKIIKQMSTEGLGLPLGVQVASMRWTEETCLRVMGEIYSASWDKY